MGNVLEEICSKTAAHVAKQKAAIPMDAVKSNAANAPPARGFINALMRCNDRPALIAEIKKASPSKGLIRADFNPPLIARAYEQGGATCLSVLTDAPYFQGDDAYLRQAREACSLPVLRKDFMIDPYQIYESRALGADCILLIMAALSDERASELHSLAKDLGMDVLVETHNQEEVVRAQLLNPEMIGVNARNLKTLAVDIQTSHDLAPKIQTTPIRVAESGITDNASINALQASGYNAFLVGESLMRQDNITHATEKLLGTI